MTNFECNPQLLSKYLDSIVQGKIQLPEFQRSWVWDEELVRNLLVSVARGFPIGSFLLLECGGDAKFSTRPIENLDKKVNLKPEHLILDGQQRLTSLTQVLKSESPVNTFDSKKRKVERYYYINIKEVLNRGDIGDAIISIGPDRKIKEDFGRKVVLDLSEPVKEFTELYFPCNQIMKSNKWERKLYDHNPDEIGKFFEFRDQVLESFRIYQLPCITLKRDSKVEAVCKIFETVNTSGVSLTVFEILTSIFAINGFNLRDDWLGNKSKNIEGRKTRFDEDELLEIVEPTDFLQAVCLVSTWQKRELDSTGDVSAKREAILSLTLDEYKNIAPQIEKGFEMVAHFLQQHHFYLRKDIPYRSQLIPLAAVMSQIGEAWMLKQNKSKLDQWFWCGVLGEQYGGTTETKISNDFEDILNWLNDNSSKIRTIERASFQPSRLKSLRIRQSAAFKGLTSLILKNNAKDFCYNMTVEKLKDIGVPLDIHHIFPKSWCEKKDWDPDIYNSILNKTPISSKTNQLIGAKSPKQYTSLIISNEMGVQDETEMRDIMESHGIDYETLIDDNDVKFDLFIEHRKKVLIEMIEKAMGKKVSYEED